MIRKLILLIIFLNPVLLFSQYHRAKAYRNSADFINDKPCYQTTFRYVQKKSEKYHGAYKVKSDELVIPAHDIKYGIWIISDGDYYFLNGTRNDCKDGYIKLKKGSDYYYFMAEPATTSDQLDRMAYSATLFGAVGGAVTGAIISKENRGQLHHVFDLKSGQTYLLTKNYIRGLLADYPILMEKYDNTENNEDIEVLEKFLETINQISLSKRSNI
jgi:hypothetical protein